MKTLHSILVSITLIVFVSACGPDGGTPSGCQPTNANLPNRKAGVIIYPNNDEEIIVGNSSGQVVVPCGATLVLPTE